jgi:hypothetical protein
LSPSGWNWANSSTWEVHPRYPSGHCDNFSQWRCSKFVGCNPEVLILISSWKIDRFISISAFSSYFYTTPEAKSQKNTKRDLWATYRMYFWGLCIVLPTVHLWKDRVLQDEWKYLHTNASTTGFIRFKGEERIIPGWYCWSMRAVRLDLSLLLFFLLLWTIAIIIWSFWPFKICEAPLICLALWRLTALLDVFLLPVFSSYFSLFICLASVQKDCYLHWSWSCAY